MIVMYTNVCNRHSLSLSVRLFWCCGSHCSCLFLCGILKHSKQELGGLGSLVVRGEGWYGMGVCPTPVMMVPEAPSPKVLWQTCQVISGSPAMGSGLQGHRRCSEAQHMPCTCPHADTTILIHGPDWEH